MVVAGKVLRVAMLFLLLVGMLQAVKLRLMVGSEVGMLLLTVLMSEVFVLGVLLAVGTW